MNKKESSLLQRLQSTEQRLSRLRQNLSQLPAQPEFLFATIEELALIKSELQQIINHLAQTNQELISVFSHELLTPFTLLQGSLQLLAAGKFSPGSEKAQSLLEMTWKPTNHLLHLVRELLAYQQLKSGQLRILGKPCRAVELVKQAAQLTPVKGKQVGVLLSVKPVFLSVWAAPHYTILLLAHLLSNAIKFSPNRSIVTLTATLIESGATQSQTQSWELHDSNEQDSCSSLVEKDFPPSSFPLPSSQFVLFQVKDRGIGIPPAQLEKIFGGFYQVDAADSRPYNGLGLGLALAAQISQQQGGQLWAESTWGTGSTFYCTLPVYPPVKSWWVKIDTTNPQCTYYFGPFETAKQAQTVQAGYVEDLRQEQAQVMTVSIQQCQPEQLTLGE